MSFVVLTNKKFNFFTDFHFMWRAKFNILCLWALYMLAFRTSVLCEIIKWSLFLHLIRMRMNELMKCHSNDEFIHFYDSLLPWNTIAIFRIFLQRLLFYFFCFLLVPLNVLTDILANSKIQYIIEKFKSIFMQTQRNFPFNFQQFDII